MIYYLSMVIPVAILIPNLLFLIKKPTNVPQKKVETSDKILNICEKMGQIGIFTVPLFYKIRITNIENKIIFMLMVLSLVIYYGVWLRYFVNGSNYVLLFKPIWIIPIPLAISPIVYMLFASRILNSNLLLIATILFGIGHIPISYKEYKNTIDIDI